MFKQAASLESSTPWMRTQADQAAQGLLCSCCHGHAMMSLFATMCACAHLACCHFLHFSIGQVPGRLRASAVMPHQQVL